MVLYRIWPARFIPTGVGNIGVLLPSNSLTAVHPHRRGEHAPCEPQGYTITGSSPQAWGTLLYPKTDVYLMRFIPTGVGNMPADDDVALQEHGSSPQAWGTFQSCVPQQDDWRFIPTGVGNMLHQWWYRKNKTVHPHRRGEHTTDNRQS